MGWVRMDDSRADHPKMLAVGLAARGLDEACIEWCARHETDGFIPTAAVAMLSAGHGTTNYKPLVKKLVDVGRWKIVEGGWMIHDYLKYNPSAAELAQKREATLTRVKRHRNADCNADVTALQSCYNGVSNSVSNTTPDPTRPDPLLNPPPPLTIVGDEPEAAADFVEAVVEAVAQRQLAAAEGVRSPSGWLAKARSSIWAEHAAFIADHASDGLEALVDHIEPPPKPAKPDPASALTTNGRTFLPGSGWVS